MDTASRENVNVTDAPVQAASHCGPLGQKAESKWLYEKIWRVKPFRSAGSALSSDRSILVGDMSVCVGDTSVAITPAILPLTGVELIITWQVRQRASH